MRLTPAHVTDQFSLICAAERILKLSLSLHPLPYTPPLIFI
jgi:hypothetical protein